jgi:phosphoserine phosphatase
MRRSSDTAVTRLHIFDMDGTLLRGAASVELSRHLGCFAEADAVEQAWLRGEIGDVRFWELVLPLWSDATDDEIDAAFDRAPWIDGVREVFADISQSPEFFVRRLIRWGAGAAYGAAVQPGQQAEAGMLLTREDKVTIATAVLADLGLTSGDCVAYGDSTSDELLFRRLPYTVAVNGKPAIRALAAADYRGDDLRGAYRLGRGLLEAVS